jgi:RND family efflux transporter MFP subunit
MNRTREARNPKSGVRKKPKARKFLAVATLLLLAACSKHPGPATTESLPAVSARVATIATGKHEASEDVVGTVRAKLRAVIEAKVSGRVEQLAVVAGQRVKTGDLLVQIEAGEAKARLDQALAVREQADNDLKRFTTLLQQEAVTRSEFDAVQARQRIAQASVKEVETMLAYTRVTAPFDGVITRKWADVGDLAAPGKPLLEMEDPANLRFEANVPEALIQKVESGGKLRVRVATVDRELVGTVAEIAPSSDPNSRTFLAKLDLPADTGLRAGQFGRAVVLMGELSALRVPAGAVVQRGQMELVFIVADGHAQLRLVKTGKRLGDELELVSGVEAGEQVVVEGAAQLRDGQPVQARP